MATLRATFGSNLQNARKARRMSREALSVPLGCDPLTIRNWEKGTYWPAPEVVESVAKALDVSPWELFKPEGDNTRQRMNKTSLIGELVVAVSSLQENKLLTVVRFAQSLVRRLNKSEDITDEKR